MRARTPLSILLGLAVLVVLSPAGAVSRTTPRPRCAKLFEKAGCVLRSAYYEGTTKYGGPTYGLRLTIGGVSTTIRGALRGTCTNTPPGQPPARLVPLVSSAYPIYKLPKTMTVGQTYTRSGHYDKVVGSGQSAGRLIADESVTIKIISAKSAKVTASTHQTSQFTGSPDSQTCSGNGIEVLKRKY